MDLGHFSIWMDHGKAKSMKIKFTMDGYVRMQYQLKKNKIEDIRNMNSKNFVQLQR